jgi:hypothetical protein
MKGLHIVALVEIANEKFSEFSRHLSELCFMFVAGIPQLQCGLRLRRWRWNILRKMQKYNASRCLKNHSSHFRARFSR